MEKLPISVIIFTFNEVKLIKDCLESVQFFQEIIVVDLGSTDGTIEIVKSLNINLISHPKVLIPDVIRMEFIHRVNHDWILFLDPDERIDKSLYDDLKYAINSDYTGIIELPWRFYFKGKRLKGTFWGGNNLYKFNLFHKYRYALTKNVHGTYYPLDSIWKVYRISLKTNNVIHHYWMNSFNTLLEKHLRYLKLEGESNYLKGKRFSRFKQIKSFFTSFYDSFIIYKGYLDGFTGIGLSVFYAWYNYCIYNSLRKYEKSKSKPYS